jgi:hypothetical protein
MRFLVTHPPDPRPALVVETVSLVDEETLASFKELLLRLGCPNGLVFDQNDCVIVRDTYATLDVASLEEDARVATDRLLARVANGRGLEQRVLDWLRSMAASWNEALPIEQDVAAPFITDIVPAVSGSSIRQVA